MQPPKPTLDSPNPSQNFGKFSFLTDTWAEVPVSLESVLPGFEGIEPFDTQVSRGLSFHRPLGEQLWIPTGFPKDVSATDHHLLYQVLRLGRSSRNLPQARQKAREKPTFRHTNNKQAGAFIYIIGQEKDTKEASWLSQ